MSANTNTTEAPLTAGHLALVFGVLFALWMLLVGSLDPQEILAGLFVALVVTGLFRGRMGIFGGLKLGPRTPLYILQFFGYFLVAMLRANLDLARRVLSPSLPISPAMVEVRTGLRSPLGKLMLTNTITLTPGTLSVDVMDDRILVHWVACPPGEDLEKATHDIVEPFETRLRKFLA